MAQITGVFRIGNDPELRYTQSGDSVLQLSLAYNYGKKGQDGKRPSQWVEASLWGNTATGLQPYLNKGGQVYAAIADPHIETYQKKDGSEGYKLTGRIMEIELVGGKSDNNQQGQTQQRQQPTQKPQGQPAQGSKKPDFDLDDDLIPF